MRKMLCEIDLEKARGYPGRYLEHFSTTNRAPAYAECREFIAKPGLNGRSRGGPAFQAPKKRFCGSKSMNEAGSVQVVGFSEIGEILTTLND